VVGRTAYRVVQEALTNVRKHAPGTRVQVRVSHRPDAVRLSIDNSAPPTRGGSLGTAGGGTGLLGLRRRVALVDGAVRAGPGPDGGFRVEADLPAGAPR
jgi:signal transduction histidine kinase